MKQEQEVQPQLCTAGTTERERENPAWVSVFLWVSKRSCPHLVPPLKEYWLTEILHHLPPLSK